VRRSFDVIASLAGRALRIEASSEYALSAVMPAVAHLTEAPLATGGHNVRWTIIEENDAWRPHAFGDTGAYRVRGGGFAVVQNDPASMESYRPEFGIELRAGRDGLMAGDFRAHPGCYALSAWLAGPRTQVLHAGAVAYDGAAALIVGGSGAGKSTTVLACAMAGADFLGDDLVLVDWGDDNGTVKLTVHCLFATAKLNEDSASALGAITWPMLGTTPKDKAVVAVRPRLKVARSAPIVALIVLAPPITGVPRPQPLTSAEVMASLTLTAAPVACRTGAPAAWLASAAALARRLPAYRLSVSWTLEALEPAMRAIITQAANLRQTEQRNAP
jgi:hypothetical protein